MQKPKRLSGWPHRPVQGDGKDAKQFIPPENATKKTVSTRKPSVFLSKIHLTIPWKIWYNKSLIEMKIIFPITIFIIARFSKERKSY